MAVGGQCVAPDDQEADVMIDERPQELLEVGVQFHVPSRGARDGAPRLLRFVLPQAE